MTQMTYRRLGSSGLKVSVLSFGGWMTIPEPVNQELFDKLMKLAFDSGVNFFDNAEYYAVGLSEEMMGQSIKNNGFKREDLVISTKIFWGTEGWGPNATGLSKKHLIEGLNASLKRLQLDYVDLIYAHRPDPQVPMEEVVRGFNHLINQGKAFYWGTSNWNAQEITEAHLIAKKLGLEGPVMEQPEYNLFTREKIEKDYLPIYEHFGLGTTTWSPLAWGILSGKYNDGIPEDSRFNLNQGVAKKQTEIFNKSDSKSKIEKVRKLKPIADKLGCTLAQLSIAWCAKNKNVSSVITGATKLEQLESNLQALDVIEKLTPEILNEIDEIFQSKPTLIPNFR